MGALHFMRPQVQMGMPAINKKKTHVSMKSIRRIVITVAVVVVAVVSSTSTPSTLQEQHQHQQPNMMAHNAVLSTYKSKCSSNWLDLNLHDCILYIIVVFVCYCCCCCCIVMLPVLHMKLMFALLFCVLRNFCFYPLS